MEIQQLALTGRVLWVVGSATLWLGCSQRGVVDGVISGGRASSPTAFGPYKIGAVDFDGQIHCVYWIETGAFLSTSPHLPVPWDNPNHLYQNLSLHHPLSPNPPEDDSQVSLEEGWVKGPNGRHRLWVPAEWRGYWRFEGRNSDIRTRFRAKSHNATAWFIVEGDEIVFVKF
jgi:hypothetical protein